MTGKTHQIFSVSFAFIGAVVLDVVGISNVNYYVMLVIMLAIARYGARFPDLDHHWGDVKEKTVPNRIVNIIVRGTGGKHRSRHTHSWDIAIACLIGGVVLANRMPGFVLWNGLYEFTSLDREMFLVLVVGFCSGWISHLYSDMLTSSGVYLLFWLGFKVRLVPRKFMGYRFSTDSEWETFQYKMTWGINKVLGIASITFPLWKHIV